MATIYQREGSQYWMAGFKDASGKWLYRSTKTKLQSEAWKIAHQFEGAGATMKAESPTAAQIDRVVRDIWQRHTGKKLVVNKAGDYLRQWLAVRKIKDGTRTRYSQIIEEFVEALGTKAELDLKTVETADVQAYIDSNETDGRSGTTIALNLKILRAAFGAAIRAGYIETNPTAAVEVPEAIAEEREPFTDAEIELLLAAARGTDWETVIMLGAFAGLRLGDAANLKWDAVNLDAGTLKFVPEKTSRKGRELEMPITKRLLSYLETLAGTEAAQASQNLCPTLAAKDIGGRAGLSFEFTKLMKSALVGSVVIKPRDGRSQKFSRKTAHSLRHTFVSKLANSGVSEDIRAALAGHADPKETKRYSHLNLATRRTAVDGAFGV